MQGKTMKRFITTIILITVTVFSFGQNQKDTISYETQTLIELMYGDLDGAEISAKNNLRSIPEGEVSERMVKAKRFLGTIYAKKGRIDVARIYYTRAQKTAKSLNPRNKELEDELANQLSVLNSVGKDAVPELYYDKSKVESGDLPFQTCFNLVQNGKFEEAIPSLLKWKTKLEKVTPLPKEQYYTLIICLGNAYSSLGKFDLTFNLYMNVLENQKANNNLNDPELRNIYNSMAICYYDLKNYTQALVYCIQAKQLCEQVHDFSMTYVRILSNMALCYSNLSGNFRAKMCIDEAVMMYEDLIGKPEDGQIDGLNLLNNQAMINQSIGRTEDAINGFKKITDNINNRDKSQGIYQLALNNLAICYTNLQEYNKALECFSKLHSESSEQEFIFQQNIAFAACFANKEDKCYESLEKFNSLAQENCAKVFSNFSEREREAYWSSISVDVTVLNNALANKFASIIPLSYNSTIFTKNMLLTANRVLKNVVDESGDELLQREYNIIQNKKDSLMYVSMSQEQKETYMQEVITRERHLIQALPGFTNDIFTKFGTWEDIQCKLGDNEAAIEFILLPQMENIGNSSTWYAAMIIKKDSKSPKLVSLCPRYKLKSRLMEIADGKPSAISTLYLEHSDSSLYNLIWKELDKELQGVRNIYFSPTGDLNSLSYNAIIDNNGKYLSERYNLYRLSSTSKIGEVKAKESISYESAAVYGGILYNESVEDMAIEAQNYNYVSSDNNLLAQRSEDERGGWKMLNGTITESSEINEMLNAKNVSSKLYQYGKANEESIKAYNHNSPDVLHVATHGFFIDNEEEVEKNPFLSNLGGYTSKENNLLYTGLLMAGANNAWNGKPVTNSEDGILTADEISRLDLSNTKLVILSACQTGKGHIDPIDGVFGLQRAFKKAGAGTIVMSLWKVPDDATSVLMKNFYKYILEGIDARSALIKSTEIVKEQHPEPYYWAAFVILD